MSLKFEKLEPRMLPAVNFAINAGAGLLTITSDAAADTINVVGTSLNGIEVNGQPFLGYKDVVINANGGADTINVSNLFIGGNLTINAGDGADLVSLLGLNVEKLTVRTGLGGDNVQLQAGSYVRDVSLFDLGAGSNGLNIINSRLHQTSNIFGGVDADAVLIRNGSAGKTMGVRLGDGANTFTMSRHFGDVLSYSGGAGADIFTMDNTLLQNDLAVTTGNGADVVAITSSNVEDLRVNTGLGADAVTFNVSRARLSAYITTGADADTVTMDSSVIEDEPLVIDTGAGGDAVVVTNNVFKDSVTIRTGDGTDTISLVPDNLEYVGDVRVDGGAGVGDTLTTLIIHTSIRLNSRGIETQVII